MSLDAEVGPVVPDARELLDLALVTARAARDLVRERRTAGVEVAATKTSFTDVVTEADQASQDLIRTRILGERPDDGFLGEEGDDLPSRSGVRWIVDPIDGTVNYYYGLTDCAVSIAAEVQGEVAAGVVLNVGTGAEYAAVRGGGATLDGRPIRCRDVVPLAQRLVATGFSYQPDARALQAAAWAGLLPQVRDLRRIGASALDVCHVAAGAMDAYVEEGVHPWDYSASVLVATEAGCEFRLTPGRWGGSALAVSPAGGLVDLLELVDAVGLFGSVSGE